MSSVLYLLDWIRCSIFPKGKVYISLLQDWSFWLFQGPSSLAHKGYCYPLDTICICSTLSWFCVSQSILICLRQKLLKWGWGWIYKTTMYYAVYVEADRIFGMGAWYGIFSKKGLLLKNVFVFKCRLVLTSIMLSPV